MTLTNIESPSAYDAAIIGTFPNHAMAEAAVKELAEAAFDIKKISIVGRGFHTDEHVTGFYSANDRIKFWGGNGAFWGGLWGLFLGGMFLTVPIVGSVAVMGHLAIVVASALEGAVAIGGLSALGAALYSIGIPRDSVLHYEQAIKADQFLLIVHGNESDVSRAQVILQNNHATKTDTYRANETQISTT